MTSARRFLPTDPADFGRAIVPLALLAVGAALPATRLVVLGLLGSGTAIAIGRAAPVRWAWAAAVPVAVSLAWGTWPMPALAADGSDCADPASPIAVFRIAEAGIALAVMATLAMLLAASAAQLGLRMPAKRYRTWAVAGFLAAGGFGVALGPALARPFFGDIRLEPSIAGALIPAALFAVANGVMEELVYRGALLGWSGRVLGVGPALAGQAVIFGLAHRGPDVLGSAALLVVALGVGGLLAGAVALRTRSLLIPIAVHVGFDIAVYLGLACAA